jgi:hypothetical protein
VFEHPLDTANNLARSTTINGAAKEVVRAQINSVQSGSFAWELSADGGMSWQPMVTGAGWQLFGTSGTDLKWRSVLTASSGAYAPGYRGPVCSSLDIDWLFTSAVIDSIVDVPDDQGGWVRIYVTRSGYDFSGSPSQIAGYNLYRRVDDIVLVQDVRSSGRAVGGADVPDASFSGPRDVPFVSAGDGLINFSGRYFVDNDPIAATAGAPPGVWEIITSFYATQDGQYVNLAPTLADTTETTKTYTAYYLTAHTSDPSLYFASAPDSGFSVDNIAPFAPTMMLASPGVIGWTDPVDDDFSHFVFYGTWSDSLDETAIVLGYTTGTEFDLTALDPGQLRSHYFVTAKDHVGNESGPGEWPEPPIGIGDDAVAIQFELYPCHPNPFNPSTVIEYDVAAGGGRVRLEIYNVHGQLVRELVDKHQSEGRKSVLWDGTDNRGAQVASGVYFCKLRAAGFSKTLKMTLLK